MCVCGVRLWYAGAAVTISVAGRPPLRMLCTCAHARVCARRAPHACAVVTARASTSTQYNSITHSSARSTLRAHLAGITRVARSRATREPRRDSAASRRTRKQIVLMLTRVSRSLRQHLSQLPTPGQRRGVVAALQVQMMAGTCMLQRRRHTREPVPASHVRAREDRQRWLRASPAAPSPLLVTGRPACSD